MESEYKSYRFVYCSSCIRLICDALKETTILHSRQGMCNTFKAYIHDLGRECIDIVAKTNDEQWKLTNDSRRLIMSKQKFANNS